MIALSLMSVLHGPAEMASALKGYFSRWLNGSFVAHTCVLQSVMKSAYLKIDTNEFQTWAKPLGEKEENVALSWLL